MNCIRFLYQFLPFLLIAIGGCSAPATRFDEDALRLGLERGDVRGLKFDHAVFYNRHWPPDTMDYVNVYIEGDGTPYTGRWQVSADPTPRRPLMLQLAANDPQPSVLLGRPCYHGHASDPECAPRHWTEERYSEAVVASMAAALATLLRDAPAAKTRLVGHSGGGTLAVLMAGRVSPETVVTLAANLSVRAWVEHHRFSSLHGSLDPVMAAPLGPGVKQFHFAGGRDKVVPPALIQSFTAPRQLRLRVVDHFDHFCCWEGGWPKLRSIIVEEGG
ncbi:MAG: hypothetical protein K0U93_29635 [Gammaproteobacteria bacterium]|nr:hypothetical protein [Gammaproteobacteria bacterium]